MTIRIAINGFGRIGRNVMRALYTSGKRDQIELVAINDLGDLKINAYLAKHDTVHGRFPGEIGTDGDDLVIDGDKVKVCSERDPNNLPWKDLNIDVALECTGLFAAKEKASMHLNAGAKKVLISAPAGSDVKTIVYGVNHKTLVADDVVVSNASCTTNCLAPLAKVLHDAVGINKGLMVTVHSYTNDQKLIDGYHKDMRRARSATMSMIPTKTGAAAAVGLVLPELVGKFDGYAIRVPTINVSMVDLTFDANRAVSADEINDIVKKGAGGDLAGVLEINEEPLVSCDFNSNPASSTFDVTQTRVIDNLVKVVSWYDNEWGFSNRMLDTTIAMMDA